MRFALSIFALFLTAFPHQSFAGDLEREVFFETCEEANPPSYGKGCLEKNRIIDECISRSPSKRYSQCVIETKAKVRKALNPTKSEIAQFEVELAEYKKREAIRREAYVREQYNNRPVIGMTAERAANSSWGKPETINRSERIGYVTEQWVYGNGRYLYFKNGILDSIQTSR